MNMVWIYSLYTQAVLRNPVGLSREEQIYGVYLREKMKERVQGQLENVTCRQEAT